MKGIIFTLCLSLILFGFFPFKSSGEEISGLRGNPIEESAGPITLRQAVALAGVVP